MISRKGPFKRKGRQGRSGAKRYGNKKPQCERYRREKRREKNKLRRLKRLIKRHPNDKQMVKKIRELEKFIVA